MAANSITSANSVLLLGVTGLFLIPQQLQGFGADDAYSMPMVTNAEVVMGVDGIMSSGWLPQIKEMDVTLQADSASNTFFEAWYAAEEAASDKFKAFGVINQPSVGRTYALTNGVLVGFTPFADAKKVLQPRKFQIKWNLVVGAPV
jgi:hypothetical protein